MGFALGLFASDFFLFFGGVFLVFFVRVFCVCVCVFCLFW